jgi:diguanylate cyclase (GGDEF)-like protein
MASLTTIRASARKLQDIWRDNPRIRFDVILTCVVLTAGYILAVRFEAMDRLVDFMEDHESWELDEAVFQILVLAVMLSYFVMRRLSELASAVVAKSAAEHEAQNLARHDPLTGLPNRRKFFEEIRRRTDGSDQPFAVFIIDLDHFKTINDFYGHRAGDGVLVTIAQKLLDIFPAPNLVARLGGDEFAVLLDSASDRETTQRVAHRLTFTLQEPVQVAGGLAKVSGSIGIAIHPPDGSTGEQLVHSADCAMYQSKDSGGGTYHFFQHDMEEALKERIALEKDLDVAIADHEILPHYQQIVELPSRRVIGYEALARWNHPIRGRVPPALFIPVAEDSGRLMSLTLSLLRQACDDAAAWPEHISLSINVAPSQLLNPGFLPHFMAIVTGSGLPPRRVQIEITESGLIDRVADMKRALALLHA